MYARRHVILTPTFDLLDWLLTKSEKIQKAHRLSMAWRLMDAALDFQESLFVA